MSFLALLLCEHTIYIRIYPHVRHQSYKLQLAKLLTLQYCSQSSKVNDMSRIAHKRNVKAGICQWSKEAYLY